MTHDEEMAQLLSIVSHDLRSPLTALLLGSRFAAREHGLSEQGRQVISEMEDAAEDLQRRLFDSIDLSRALHGALQLNPQSLELSDLVRGVAREAERKARLREQTLSVTGAQVFVRADTRVLPRAIFALLDHAMHNSPNRAAIAVEVATDAGGGAIRVLDRGPALVEGEHMFAMTPRPAGGRQLGGIGLALARLVAERLGGRVEASPADGGARLQLWLPASP